MYLECGGVFTTSQGRITSLNYPKNYEPNESCQWLLRTETSHTIEFKFTDFDLEDQNCTADFVSIYDGSERRDDKLLLKTCGSQTIGLDTNNNQTRLAFTKPLRSSGNEMLVIMETDDNIEAKGFGADFSTVIFFTFDFIFEILDILTIFFFNVAGMWIKNKHIIIWNDRNWK